jgi:hypothetical protein
VALDSVYHRQQGIAVLIDFVQRVSTTADGNEGLLALADELSDDILPLSAVG